MKILIYASYLRFQQTNNIKILISTSNFIFQQTNSIKILIFASNFWFQQTNNIKILIYASIFIFLQTNSIWFHIITNKYHLFMQIHIRKNRRNKPYRRSCMDDRREWRKVLGGEGGGRWVEADCREGGNDATLGTMEA